MATDGECSALAAASRKGTVRSHSEAERKRRQRINAHLATLRTLLPSASPVRTNETSCGKNKKLSSLGTYASDEMVINVCADGQGGVAGRGGEACAGAAGRADDVTEGVLVQIENTIELQSTNVRTQEIFLCHQNNYFSNFILLY